ncbi:hypothetical protein IPH25_01660 [bacterium]|nr:MAG: hypothetical protein IPG37_03790 [bacterium]QQR62133.1 MAG: hypothetical protein IPH25_01660 [bacterium]QQR63309.1 MAG: hypothetical protein IPH67_02450 [bacterium]
MKKFYGLLLITLSLSCSNRFTQMVNQAQDGTLLENTYLLTDERRLYKTTIQENSDKILPDEISIPDYKIFKIGNPIRDTANNPQHLVFPAVVRKNGWRGFFGRTDIAQISIDIHNQTKATVTIINTRGHNQPVHKIAFLKYDKQNVIVSGSRAPTIKFSLQDNDRINKVEWPDCYLLDVVGTIVYFLKQDEVSKNWYIHYLNLASVETIYQTKIDKSEKVQGPDHIIGIEKYTLFGNKELTIEATEKGITLTFDKKFTFFPDYNYLGTVGAQGRGTAWAEVVVQHKNVPFKDIVRINPINSTPSDQIIIPVYSDDYALLETLKNNLKLQINIEFPINIRLQNNQTEVKLEEKATALKFIEETQAQLLQECTVRLTKDVKNVQVNNFITFSKQLPIVSIDQDVQKVDALYHALQKKREHNSHVFVTQTETIDFSNRAENLPERPKNSILSAITKHKQDNDNDHDGFDTVFYNEQTNHSTFARYQYNTTEKHYKKIFEKQITPKRLMHFEGIKDAYVIFS